MLRLPLSSVLFATLLGAAATAQSTTRISLDSAGAQSSGDSVVARISGDGHWVVFQSQAPSLVAGDTNARSDVFVRDLGAGLTLRVSVDSAGLQGNEDSRYGAISADGRFVAFESQATNLVAGDTNGSPDVFVHDRQSGQTTRVSVGAGGAQGEQGSYQPTISADGRYVCFFSYAGNLVPGDTNLESDVFVHDRTTGQTSRVSLGTGGVQADEGCYQAAISADGGWIAFGSRATNLVAGDLNGLEDVFVHERATGVTQRVSVDSAGAEAAGLSFMPALTADGQRVAFVSSAANLVAGDTNNALDVFVHDLAGGLTQRVSLSSAGQQGNFDSGWRAAYFVGPALSPDGQLVAFSSAATNLVAGDSNNRRDVFLRDLQLGVTTRVSLSTGGLQGSGDSESPSIAEDGRSLVFHSASSNLVTGDTNSAQDVFLRYSGIPPFRFCFGDGTQATPCPCGNSGLAGNGCDNSIGSLGASLSTTGTQVPDTIVLLAQGELPTSLSIFLQGNTDLAVGVPFGDGVRCVGGTLKRLYVHNAVNSTVSAPVAGDLSITAQSALLGDPIAPGTSRSYQVYYRDPNASFCPAPTGGNWNVTSAVHIDW
jgi:Tol biopolymer transport system component